MINKKSEPHKTFEQGKLFKDQCVSVLHLCGDYRGMGRQYGSLLADDLRDLLNKAVNQWFIKNKGLDPSEMLSAASSLFQFYPERFKQFIFGMSETSKLSREEHILLNALELYGVMPGCSSVFAWDEFTGNKPLIAGRNYDWFDSYADFVAPLTLTVLNPPSAIPTAFVTFPGVFYATTGMNAAGLFVQLNNGLPSGGGLEFTNRVHVIVNLLTFLLDYSTLDQFDAAMNTTRSNFSFIINAADRNRGYSYEWPPFDLKKRHCDQPGLLISSNHFVHPDWGIGMQCNTGFKSIQRRENLLDLARKLKGRINIDTMKTVLETPIEKGGATWPEQGTIRTVYQVIAEPETLRMWLRVPEDQNWTEVDLKSFMNQLKQE
ncbi:C45 family autoproteolytic acyltransferase/hydolase [Desulfonatronovibrio magnus]|uniref:C45 family autoproteolytic acyltransferase/hydolase n=1 Tax=Desulfonatronovibrio magnus TaxID=698827 RepID=UPI000697FE5F|nr:C45 family peptidase [Desulfonatronovibrio magnus]RQD61835.1 MAG: hypothetical protein D5R98_06485 [Desulfonatronovibrio sp. MSAO_Bac4]